MKPFSKKVLPVNLDSDQWGYKSFTGSVVTAEGESIDYDGVVLSAKQLNQHHLIEFEFKTTMLRPAEVVLPLWISAAAVARLYVNDHFVGTLNLVDVKPGVTTVKNVSVDVTKWSEATSASRLTIKVFYPGEPGTVTIPIESTQSEHLPRVLQKWAWGYALKSSGFVLATWSSILALTLIAVAHLQALSETIRFYAVLVTVITWFAAILGIPDLAKIPLRGIVRKIYWRTAPYRTLMVILMTVVLMLSSLGAFAIARCLLIRHKYSVLIQQALDNSEGQDDFIRSALILQPWRREAQLLFEMRILGLRGDRKNYKRFINNFASQYPDLESAIVNAPSKDALSCCFDKNASSAFSDPLVWYANIIPEGDPDDVTSNILTEKSARLLAPRKDVEATMLRLYMELFLNQHDERRAKELAEQLGNLLSRFDTYTNVAATHTYQFACDLLGTYYVSYCRSEEAAAWFTKEIETRTRQAAVVRENNQPIWSRPPEKLTLYYFFRSYSETNRLSAELIEQRVKPLLDYKGEKNECEPFRTYFTARVLEPYSQYKEESAWKSGTIIESNPRAHVRNLLSQGWSY